MRIVVLAIEGWSTWALVNALRVDYPSMQVVLERPVSRWRVLLRRLSRLGARSVLGQFLFMLLLPLLRLESKKRVSHLMAEAEIDCRMPTNIRVWRFASVNSKECIEWVCAQNPDAIILNGTRIVSPALLGASRAVFINTHCGITPTYRGVHGGYWALHQMDEKRAGVTVHLVDSGIDTGGILYQAPIEVDRSDNFFTYPVKQYIAGIPLVRRALADAAAGRLNVQGATGVRSALWYHPTLSQYLTARFRRGVR